MLYKLQKSTRNQMKALCEKSRSRQHRTTHSLCASMAKWICWQCGNSSPYPISKNAHARSFQYIFCFSLIYTCLPVGIFPFFVSLFCLHRIRMLNRWWVLSCRLFSEWTRNWRHTHTHNMDRLVESVQIHMIIILYTTYTINWNYWYLWVCTGRKKE